MRKIGVLFVVLLASLSMNANATLLTNGDFLTNDLSDWEVDTDGFGAPTLFTDFDASSGAAIIDIDMADSEAFFANTLFQTFDSFIAAGFGLSLSFDWMFSGEEGNEPSGDRDYWLAYIGDGSGSAFDENGNLGVLFEGNAYGSGIFTVDLGSALFNQSGLSIEFQLLAGAAVNLLGSSLQIDNVSITPFSLDPNSPTPVPEPSTLGLLFIVILFPLRKLFTKN